jgi:hypothetical protein
VILVGLAFSLTGLLWLSQLSLAGVDRQDAGAVSGRVNVMQQVGGALGLAVLVRVFATVSKNDAAQHSAGTALEQAHHAFVAGADRGFLIAATVLAASWLLVAAVVRTPQNAVSTQPAPID